MYNIGLWKYYNTTVINKFRSAYHKSIKKFFGFSRMDSMTNILLLLKLSSFGTVMHNASVLAHAQRLRVQNSIIQYLNEILV